MLCLAPSVFALTPPWDEEDLKRSADLIVEGEVGSPIQCLGLIDQTKCYDRYKYLVPMKIEKIHKGKAKKGETFPLYVYHLDYSKSHCTGDQDASHFPGERGTYYLRRLEDGALHQNHWSGMKITKEGSGSLPKCP